MSCTSEQFRLAMRRFPASVCVIATGEAPNRVGLTATAVCSLSAAPPQILVCLNAETGTCKAIREGRTFSVNMLTSEQLGLARRFAGIEGGAIGEERFEAGAWRKGANGAPVLNDAMMTFECRLVTSHAVATHVILIGEVLDIPENDHDDALLYRSGAFGTWAPLPEAAAGARA
ncbi:flavin reductase family protein [Mesorhizobium sp. KR2-14]|uniref:flavin reductase family protein n=1 Tax=Mesorhizobium sp. KR2-14 TaxID=3156610 RepID=UPI0032B3402F